MQRLLSELPGAAQIVAYQEEDPDPTVVTPTLTRNPSVLSFSAIQNGSSPGAQALTVTNTGPGTLTWIASANSAWLTLNGATSTSGTNLGSISVRVNPAGLSVGTHSGLITIVGTGATNSPQTVSVSFDVTAAPTPTIGLSATTLSFSAIQGGSNPANKTISVSNSGSGTLNWTATENASWLSLSPASGAGSGTISVAVNTSGLSAGTVSSPITIAASGSTNTPQTVTVSLTITAAAVPPAIGVTPGSLTFTAQQGGGNPTPQSLAIRNTGGGTLTWTVSNNSAWLSHSPTSGTGNSVVTISPITGSLTAGTYNGIITLYATGSTTVNVPITFTITAPAARATIGMSPTNLSFNATAGGSNPSTQSLAITNTGTGTLTWTVTDNANWLTATQSGNSVVASINIAGLAVGSYSGIITVSASGATNTPQAVPVTLTIAAATQPTTGTVTLSWVPNSESDLAGYKVYRATSSGGYGAPIATLTAGTNQYVSSGLAKGFTYFFVITAYDEAGNESPYSSETSKSVY
ncbi:BACON domain-containing protein [Nitrospira lenta]